MKRIYGDFTSPNSAQWKKVLNRYAIKPVQQFAYTTGKNATDSTLIIDAMDLLYTRRFDGFCLVSATVRLHGSRLAHTRGRPERAWIRGKKTPRHSATPATKFVFTEVLRPVGKCQRVGIRRGLRRCERPPETASETKNGERTEQQAFPTEFVLGPWIRQR